MSSDRAAWRTFATDKRLRLTLPRMAPSCSLLIISTRRFYQFLPGTGPKLKIVSRPTIRIEFVPIVGRSVEKPYSMVLIVFNLIFDIN